MPSAINSIRFERPWLQLYDPVNGCLLAQRIFDVGAQHSAAEDAVSSLSFECWLEVAAHLPPSDFAAICRLGSVCRALRAISRHPDLWERCCRFAFSHRGFLPCDDVLRLYDWSWRTMFRRRCRLRTDGLYYIATTKILKSTQEGRGMKEADKDLYTPGGLWVTSYRILRFFSDGAMFSYLCAAQTPTEIRKSAAVVSPCRPASLVRAFRDALWGSYSLEEGKDATTVEARVRLESAAYPNMQPTTLVYQLLLRPDERTNARLRLLMALEGSGDAFDVLEVRQDDFCFLPFDGHVPPMQRPGAPVWDRRSKALVQGRLHPASVK